jgi:hypothetical protein
MSLNENERRELERLAALYRELPRAQPPEALDRAILAKASAAVAAPRGMRWTRSLATAAVLAVAVGIGWQLRDRGAPLRDTAPAPASAPTAPQDEADVASTQDALPIADESTDAMRETQADPAKRLRRADAQDRAAANEAPAEPSGLRRQAPKQSAPGVADDRDDGRGSLGAIAPEQSDTVDAGAGASARTEDAPQPFADLGRDRALADEERKSEGVAAMRHAEPAAEREQTAAPVMEAIIAEAPAAAPPEAFEEIIESAPPPPPTAPPAPAASAPVAPAPVAPAPAVAPQRASKAQPSTSIAAQEAREEADTAGRLDEMATAPLMAPEEKVDAPGTEAPRGGMSTRGLGATKRVGDTAKPDLDRRTAKRWLAGIRELIARRELDEAREELARLRERHPRFEIPVDVTDAVK